MAESNHDLAFKINSQSTEIIAELSRKHSYKMIYVSTDYVFDGKKNSPYTETDSTNPLNIYGKSKLAGEKAVLELAHFPLILRTSWLYSNYGINFVKKITQILKEKSNINVINDQVGSLTNADDFAKVILQSLELEGLYHYSSEGSCSWFDIAALIKKTLSLECRIDPCTTEYYNATATRPNYSLLSKNKIKQELKIEIKNWDEQLISFLKTIKN